MDFQFLAGAGATLTSFTFGLQGIRHFNIKFDHFMVESICRLFPKLSELRVFGNTFAIHRLIWEVSFCIQEQLLVILL